VATVIIAGVFAFMPVEKVSTVHGLIGGTTILTTTMTLPQNNDDILLVIDCGPNGGLIIDVFLDNSRTTGNQKDFDLKGIDASTDNDTDSDRSYRGALSDTTFAKFDIEAYRSLWDKLWPVGGNDFHHFNGIVCPPGEFIIMEWETENGNNDVIVDVFVSYAGDITASVSTTPD